MAVVDLQLSSLTMEQLPDAYDKIIEAFCERKSILNAFNLDVSYDQDFYRFTDSYGFLARHQPNFAMCMNALMAMVNRLSRSFIDTDAEYIAGSYSNFPKNFTKAVRADTEHILGTCVKQYDSFTEDSLENWKKLLACAAYWMNKFTKIRPSASYCSTFQRCRLRTNSWQNDPNWGTFPVREDEEYSDPMTIDLIYSSTQDFHPSESDPDDEEYYGSCTGSGRTGLAIDNRTPYPAKVYLYLCLPSVNDSDWNNDYKWQTISYEMRICGNEWHPNQDEVYPGEMTKTERTLVDAGGQKIAKEAVDVVEYSMGRDTGTDNYQISRTKDTLKKNYSHDGSLEIVTLSSQESWGPDQSAVYLTTPKNSLTFDNTRLWDGLGIWSSPSEPILAETIPARTKKRIAATNFTSLPMAQTELSTITPDDWDRGSYWWEENYSSRYSLQVVPILDFTDSITTFNVPDESSQSPEGEMIGG